MAPYADSRAKRERDAGERWQEKQELISRFNHCNNAVNAENCIILAPGLLIVYMSHKAIDGCQAADVRASSLQGKAFVV